MKLTAFGKAVRKNRIEAEMKLSTMATALNISVAYLSALETGRKKLTDPIVEKVVAFFKGLEIDAEAEIRSAADRSQTEFRLNTESVDEESRELVAAFARRFPEMSEAKKKELWKLLDE